MNKLTAYLIDHALYPQPRKNTVNWLQQHDHEMIANHLVDNMEEIEKTAILGE